MRSVTSGRAAKVDGRGPWRLTGSFSNAKCWFLTKAPRRSALHEGTPIHCTRDASWDIKPGCQDHHPPAIVPPPRSICSPGSSKSNRQHVLDLEHYALDAD